MPPLPGPDAPGAALACYCFAIPPERVTRETLDFVRGKVKAGECSCRELNPSGKCCLPVLGRLVADGAGSAP